MSKLHPVILVVRFLTGLTLSLLREVKYGFIAPIAIQLAYVALIIFRHPYKKAAVSIRAIINEAVIVVIFAVNVVYGLETMNAEAMATSS